MSGTFGRRPDQPQQYFPALDGLRGLMAIGVVIAHANMDWFPGSAIMMDIFFVISGFLITLILMRNVQRSGNLQLFRFWGRRIKRLYPVLLVVVGVYLLAAALLFENPSGQFNEAISVLLYYSNWTKIGPVPQWGPSYFSHTWSLSIEEQFYVLWPLLLLAALKCRLRYRDIVILFIFLTAIEIFWRNWLISHGAIWSRLYYGLDTRMDAFLTGGILAIAWNTWHEKWYRQKGFMIATQICAILLFLTLIYWEPFAHYKNYFRWQQSVVLLLSCGAILALNAPSGNYLKLFFTLKPFRILGLMCYSIYLWHEPLIWLLRWNENNGNHPFHLPEWMWRHGGLGNLSMILVIVISLSYLSYRYIELPILSKRT